MKNVNESYTAFHQAKRHPHVYPTEWVVRTLLGTYPNLTIDKSRYSGGSIVDIGFGDGRNWPLLHNIGFDIHGVEITPEIVALGNTKADELNIPVKLAVGTNASIPFPDAYFDYALAFENFSTRSVERQDRITITGFID